MHVVLLDSDHDLRRYPFAHESSAALLPVLESSLLHRAVRWARAGGAREVYFATRRNPAADYRLASAVIENELRPVASLGEALDRARRELRMDEPLLVMSANLHHLPHFPSLMDQHMRGRQAVTFVRGSSVSGPGLYSYGPPVMALCSPVVSRMMRFDDHPKPLPHLLRRVRERRLGSAGFDPDQRVLQIDNSYALYHANLDVLSTEFVERTAATVLGLSQADARLWLAPGANVGHVRVDPTGGPVIVGRGATVEDGAILRGPTIVGAGSHVGGGSCLHRSLVLAESALPSRSWVANSVVSSRLRQRVAA